MHRDGDGPVRIDRPVPLYWLVTVVVASIFNAGIVWSQFGGLKDNQTSTEKKIENIIGQLIQKSVSDAELKTQHEETKRRIMQLELAVKQLESKK